MNLSKIGVVLGMAVATIGFAAYADDHRQAASGMQAVAVSPQAGEPGHGWQYFSDARKPRAVVISPNGDYYYSRGDGLQLVFKAMPAGHMS